MTPTQEADVAFSLTITPTRKVPHEVYRSHSEDVWISDQHEQGNLAAWCRAAATASWGEMTGTASIEPLSYASEADLWAAVIDELLEAAIFDLNQKAGRIVCQMRSRGACS